MGPVVQTWPVRLHEKRGTNYSFIWVFSLLKDILSEFWSDPAASWEVQQVCRTMVEISRATCRGLVFPAPPQTAAGVGEKGKGSWVQAQVVKCAIS